MTIGAKFISIVYLACVITIAGFIRPVTDDNVKTEVNSVNIANIEKRVENIEAQHVDVKLAAIESTVNTDHQLLIAVSIAIALMGIESIVRFGKTRKMDRGA
jgi:hypothetical protein